MIRKAIAAFRLVQCSTGRPLIKTNPRPLSTSSSNNCSWGPSLGSCALVIAATSTDDLSNSSTTRSTSATSASDRCVIQSVRTDSSLPYQAERSRIAGGTDVCDKVIELI